LISAIVGLAGADLIDGLFFQRGGEFAGQKESDKKHCDGAADNQ